MKRVMVYSHDTFGLGNVRITASVCQKLVESIPGISILVISGSPMIHSVKLPKEVDYVKLPCVRRTDADRYAVKFLGTETKDILKMRSELIVKSIAYFHPRVLLVDKKPYGVASDLMESMKYLDAYLPETKRILLFRDILDKPEITRKIWGEKGYLHAIESYYDLVLSFGFPEIFDIRKEYQFSQKVSERVRFIGHIQPKPGRKSRSDHRKTLGLGREKMILVTPGGGEDGYNLLKAYVLGLNFIPAKYNTKHMIVCGPEMPKVQRDELQHLSHSHSNIQFFEFIDDMMSYMDASDLVVAMGGYNTICEILFLNKPAILVPRFKPVAEQWIRAERMSRLGFFTAIHPDTLTPEVLAEAIVRELYIEKDKKKPTFKIQFDALEHISQWVSRFMIHQEPRSLTEAIKGKDGIRDGKT